MKQIPFIILFFCSFNSKAQQEPFFSSEGFTSYWNNPASVGSWNTFSVSTVGRLQWVGVTGAPNTFKAAVEMDTKFSGKSSKKSVNIPLGITFIAEEIGFQKTQALYLPISIPIKIKETTLAFGLAPGFKRINFVTFTPPSTTPDPLLPLVGAGTKFQLQTGVYWYSPKFYLGLSASQITSPFYGIGFSSAIHYWAQAAYRFKLNQHSLVPMIQAGTDGAGLHFRSITYFQFKEDIFSIGAGFSSGRDILLAATYRFKKFKIAYNFDWDLGPFSNYTVGSHELRLSYVLPKTTK